MPYGSYLLAISLIWRLFSNELLCTPLIYIERFWRSVKYEDVYHKLYQTGQALFDGLTQYIRFYNQQRPHQSLNYATPAEVYLS